MNPWKKELKPKSGADSAKRIHSSVKGRFIFDREEMRFQPSHLSPFSVEPFYISTFGHCNLSYAHPFMMATWRLLELSTCDLLSASDFVLLSTSLARGPNLISVVSR